MEKHFEVLLAIIENDNQDSYKELFTFKEESIKRELLKLLNNKKELTESMKKLKEMILS